MLEVFLEKEAKFLSPDELFEEMQQIIEQMEAELFAVKTLLKDLSEADRVRISNLELNIQFNKLQLLLFKKQRQEMQDIFKI